ncbi:hypothetical protein [Borreliella bissettiae]|uniref:hypothetical protein n=1 Tax=Borrelia bissettiae TaxID=64897 RepID=UPI003AA9BB8E
MTKKTMFAMLITLMTIILNCKSNNGNNKNNNEEILGNSKFFTNEKENNKKYSWIATKSEERPENWLNENHALMRLINSNRGIFYDFDFNNITTKHDIGFYDIYDIRSNKIKIKYSFDNEKESELTIGISECRITPEEIKHGNIVCYSAANLYNHSYIFTSLRIPPSKSEDFSKKVLTSKTLKIAFEIFKEPIAFNLENHKKLYEKYQKHFIKEDNSSKTKNTSIKIDKN